MFGALALGAAGILWRYSAGHPEAMLWLAVLAAQALPYFASLASAAISARAAVAVAARPTTQPAGLKPVAEAGTLGGAVHEPQRSAA
ncbi:MAG: hypothetical protein M5U08_24160 [Burkholderiales bacterium]|nr:hypothetical protein [Burkholderiales bacterium]